jgi:hypothetical protein
MSRDFFKILGCDGISQEMFKWFLNGREATSSGLEKLQSEALTAFADFHEKAIQPILKMPQVGLTRVYQEKFNLFVDKFNTYLLAVAEFQQLLSAPMEKSLIMMKKEFARKDQVADDFKTHYAKWIEILEGLYKSLFISDEYRQALARLLSDTAAFKTTANDVLITFLAFLPIPNNQDMDEIYKELYTLKKQGKEAAKKIREMESRLAKEEIL